MSFLTLAAVVLLNFQTVAEVPHLDLETSGSEIVEQLKRMQRLPLASVFSAKGQNFQDILNAGTRNLAWLNEINRYRESVGEAPISLYERGQLGGIPIEKASAYSGRSIRSDFTELQNQLPKEMAEVIFSERDFPVSLPFSDEIYRDWAKKIDRSYQYAARWILMEPYLEELAEARRYDIRGYYFLNGVADLETELNNYENIEPVRKQQLKDWILQLCFLDQSYSDQDCERKFQRHLKRASLNEMVLYFWENGARTYQYFFEIPNYVSQSNLKFIDPITVVVNFVSHSAAAINDFLSVNIEDEWRGQNFNLKVAFDQGTSDLIEVRWLPGVTPHVNGLGGRRITMDANSSLEDWDTQWTIRHELGHVIGLPDCYLEFYNPNTQEIIGYQIDIEDLMCSRRGKINERIISEVKRHYLD